MDEMTWTDPQLKARYERNLKAMEQRRAAHPELLNKWAVPYKVFTRSSLHGIQNMRINWLMDNHPQQFREMMMAQRARGASAGHREAHEGTPGTDCGPADGVQTPAQPDRLPEGSTPDDRPGPAQWDERGASGVDEHGNPRDCGKLLNANADVHLGSVPKRLCLIVPVFQSLRLFPR